MPIIGTRIPSYGGGARDGGLATFNGDGSGTTFAIAHTLGVVANYWNVTPASSGATGDYYVINSGAGVYPSGIQIIYKTAPPSGTNNVVLSWSVFV